MSISIFVILGAIAIGLSLGLLGSGGSILTVPVLVYLVGQDEKIAIASSMFIVASIAGLGALPYLKQKLIDWKVVWLFGIPGMIGTYAGSWLTSYISGTMQFAIFAVVMLMASYFMLKPKTKEVVQTTTKRSVVKIISDGLMVGVLTGIVGVGGGFLIIPALVLLGGLPMRVAVASSLVIIMLKSYIGFIKHFDLIKTAGLALDWQIIGLMVLIGGIGSFIGNKLSSRIPQDKLKKGFGVFLVIMALYILFKEVPKLL